EGSLVYPRLRKSKPWFDSECYAAKQICLQALKLAKTQTFMRNLYVSYRRQFQQLIRAKKYDYEQGKENMRLIEAETVPHCLLQKARTIHSCPVPLTEWLEHFKDLLSKDTISQENNYRYAPGKMEQFHLQ